LWNVEDVIVCSDGGYAINGTYVNSETNIYWGFVLKTDSDGNMLWANKDTVSFQIENESRAIIDTDDGGILSASYTTSTQGCTALIKRDIDGNREWTEPLDDIYIQSMSKTSDNNIITAGYTPFNNQAWPCLAKLDQEASIIWSQAYIIENYEWGIVKSVVPSLDGGYLLTGYVKDNETGHAILAIKTDAEGDSLWTRIWDETSQNDDGQTIVETNSGDILVGGYLEYISGFIWKLDHEGNTIWFETS